VTIFPVPVIDLRAAGHSGPQSFIPTWVGKIKRMVVSEICLP